MEARHPGAEGCRGGVELTSHDVRHGVDALRGELTDELFQPVAGRDRLAASLPQPVVDDLERRTDSARSAGAVDLPPRTPPLAAT